MRLLTVAFFLLLTSTLSAQTSVHFDRPFHVAGEVAWFSAFLPQPAPPKVRVAVYTPDGSEQDYFFLEADEQGQISGYYRWPFGLETGYYRLGLQGMTEGKEVVALGMIPHAVYNDKRTTEITAGTLSGTDALPASGGLSVDVDGGNVRIGGLNGAAFSISVVNADITGDMEGFQVTPFTPNFSWADTLFYPGNVMTAAGDPFSTNLLPIFDPATFNFGFAKSDEKGDFMLEIGPFTGKKDVQVRAQDAIDLQPKLYNNKVAPLNTLPPVTEAVATYIDLSRRRRKIYQLFATVETEIDAKVLTQERKALKPNRDFNVQDYKAFSDMYNFFKEVGGELRVRVKKDNYRAQLYNAPNQRFFAENPLYIVDGKLTRDDNYVNTMSPGNVKYLAYYYIGSELRRNFPALGNNGVVQIETVRPVDKFPAADADDIFFINGLQPMAAFPLRDAAASEVPALSPVLLWQTGRADETATIKLPTTDDYGNYKVVVFARGADGSLRSASKMFEVAVK
ncbi:MAG: hypothetical protein ACI81P_002959 [Neolewinella sp.]|jgi:hypothetical protein